MFETCGNDCQIPGQSNKKRSRQGKATNAEFQGLLDGVLQLYQFTDDKDVFRMFYHKSLAKRLLLEKSASDDFEKGMLKKLKECTWFQCLRPCAGADVRFMGVRL
jgi:hypothetical protein